MPRSSVALAIGLLAATAGSATAEETRGVAIRQVNTAARVIGCTRYTPECAGATSIRSGLVVVDVATGRLRYGRVVPVGMFHGAARPDGGLLASQMIAGGGARVALWRGWIQGGAGFAASQVAPGPKTITTTDALAHAVPAALLGVGARSRAFDVPFEVSLDLATSVDGAVAIDHLGRIYQVTANVLVSGL